MDRILRILILEDLPSDAELMVYELRHAQIPHVYHRVDNRKAFLKELEVFSPDLILSDFHLPDFDGLTALALAREKCPEVPFIFVSGAMGEEVAIETLKSGATDYVLKDRITRLVPAVTRALAEAAERRERRRAQQALQESEQKYRLLVNTVPAIVYRGFVDCSVDFVDGKIEQMCGYSKEEFDSRRIKWDSLVIPQDHQLFKEAFVQGLKGSKSFIREYRIRSKEGKVIWIQDRGQIICDPDGAIEYISGVFFDVTDRRRWEETLRESERRLRFLTSQLLTAQERERKRISMELHDELGQNLMVLKLQIRAIYRSLPEEQTEPKAECLALIEYLDKVIDNVRRLSRDLSPAILEDLGLKSALKYLLDGVSRHFQVRQSLDVRDLDQMFTQEAQIIIYRIFQECLTNISKHAHANTVSATVLTDGDWLSLVLEDDGTGFDINEVLTRNSSGRGLGLAALDERTRMLGGSLEIQSRLGAGTRVTCRIPIKSVKEKEESEGC